MDSILNFLYTNITGNIVNFLVYLKNGILWFLDQTVNLVIAFKGFVDKWGSIPVIGLVSGPIILPLEAIFSILHALCDAFSFVIKGLGDRLDAFSNDLPTATYSIFAFTIGLIFLWPYILRIQDNPMTQGIERAVVTPVTSAFNGLRQYFIDLAKAHY